MTGTFRRSAALVVAMAVVGLLASRAWATGFAANGAVIGDDTTPIKTVVLTASGEGVTNSAGSFGPNQLIYGFKLYATASNANCGLYDGTTVASGAVIDELGEATSNEAKLQFWPNPVKLTTDLSVHVQNGTCVVYYR